MTQFVTLLFRALLPVVVMALSFALHPAPVRAQASEPMAVPTMATMRSEVDQIEAVLQRPGLDGAGLNELRARVTPLFDTLRGAAAELEPRLREADGRLQQIGAKADEKGPAEAPEVVRQREEIVRERAEFDAQLRNIRLLETRANQISDRINNRRRQLFTEQVMERSNSPVTLAFWSDAAEALPRWWRSVEVLAGDWLTYLRETVGPLRLLAAAATTALCGTLLTLLMGFARRRRIGLDGSMFETSAARKVAFALRILFERAVPAPLLAIVIVGIAIGFELVLPRARPLLEALCLALLAFNVARGVLDAVLAPRLKVRRLVTLDDDTAAAFYGAGRNAAAVVGVALALFGLNAVLIAPVPVTALTAALFALAMAAVALHYLQHTDREDDEDDDQLVAGERGAYAWTRPLLWLAVGAIIAALVSGYVALASFLALRLALIVLVWLSSVLLLRLFEAVVMMWFGARSARGRRVAAIIGVRPERLELIGVILLGVARVLVLLLALFMVLAPWNAGVDGGDPIDLTVIGLRLVELRGLIIAIAGALAILVIGLVLLRRVLAWVGDDILPRTGLEPGLSNSIGTILGYAGFAAVAMLALRHLGIDFSNIGIVAGALSVGIGFGLQSIVSNFVSGLIVLAERPIRVGDTIIVKGEEGRVRRISVRSTEIETADRATVIVPNSDLITSVVKNLTHPDNRGRLVLALVLGHGADLAVAVPLLVKVAAGQEGVRKEPPPSVVVRGFSAEGIQMDVVALVGDTAQLVRIRSELAIAVQAALTAAGIPMAQLPPHTG